MKKILALILAALMVLTMVACAAKAEPAADAEQTTTTEPAEETTPEQTAPAEETTEEPAVGGTISVFATSYTDAKLEMFQEIINDFTAETGIQVDLITPGSEGEAQLKGVMCAVADESCIGEFGLRVSETEEILVFINDGGESCDALLIRNCFAVVCKVLIDRNECFDCGIVCNNAIVMVVQPCKDRIAAGFISTNLNRTLLNEIKV